MTRVHDLATDDDLMVRFKGGDPAAFEALYDRYEAQLFGLCLSVLGNRAEAEDALQEAFAKVVDRRESFEPKGRFRSWIFTIVRFTCMDRLRVAATEQRFLTRMDSSEKVASPGDAVLARTDVERLLACLPDEQREALALHRLHGLTQAEIASVTDSTEAAVRQKVYRALKTLRERVGETEGRPE